MRLKGDLRRRGRGLSVHLRKQKEACPLEAKKRALTRTQLVSVLGLPSLHNCEK
jgi:hypothetical protein